MADDSALFAENERTAPTADARSYARIGNFELEVNGKLPDVEIAYETWGELNEKRDNAILVCHALSGDSHAIGWWERVVGPGKGLDPAEHFIVCSNVLGGCQGSTGPASTGPDGRTWGRRFPVITIGDMVEAQARLADELGVKNWKLVCGGSMGGMQALEWARRFPDRVERVWMTASCGAHSAMQIGFNEAGRQAIMRDPAWAKDEHPADGLSVARMIGHLTYLSDASFDRKFGRRLQDKTQFSYDGGIEFQVESYLNYQGDKFTDRFDANSYLVLTRAIDYFDGFSELKVNAKFLITCFNSDWIYPSYQSELIHNRLCEQTESELREIDLSYGHDSFLLDGQAQVEFLSRFLNK